MRVIIVLIPQSAPQYKARCDLFRPFPRAHPSRLSFELHAFMPDRTAAHLLEAPRGVLVRLAALKLACFSGKDTRQESK